MVRSNFQQQGGFADWNDPTMLLDRSAQVQAQSYDQLAAIEAATAMAKAQVGGRRRSYRKHSGRKHKGSRKHSGRKHKGSRKHGHRRQRGGMASFDAPYTYGPPQQVFKSEVGITPGFGPSLGAQPFLESA